MDELERFKTEINLADYAASQGYELDRKESSRSSLVMRCPANGDKIIVATGEDGHAIYFSVRDDGDNGSILDFIMHRQHCTFREACQILRHRTPFPFPTAASSHHPKPEPIPRDRAALVAQWHRFAPYSGGYLQERGLSAATLALVTDRLRLDGRGNAVFRHDDRSGLTGWEVKNRGFTGFAAGGTKAFFAVRAGIPPQAEPPRLVLAESAIDALSFHQVDSAPALLLSFGGGMSPDQEALLAHILMKYPAAAVLAATDADEQGEEYAAIIAAIRPDTIRAKPSKGNDWNDVIRPPDREGAPHGSPNHSLNRPGSP